MKRVTFLAALLLAGCASAPAPAPGPNSDVIIYRPQKPIAYPQPR